MELDFKKRNSDSETKEYFGDEINLREIIEKYAYHWKWFVLCILVALSLAYVKLRYTSNIYQVSSTIFIDNKESGFNNEFSAFEDLEMLGSNKSSLPNEIGKLKSRALMKKVVLDLGINITYYEKGDFLNKELYGENIPFKLNIFANDTIIHKMNTSFIIQSVTPTSYVIKKGEEGEENYYYKKALFGKNESTFLGDINVTLMDQDNINFDQEIIINISSLEYVAINYMYAVQIIEPENPKSSILMLSLNDRVRSKAIDVLNYLVKHYNRSIIDVKSQMAKSTDDFINKRITGLYEELNTVDRGVEDFKRMNKLTNIDYESELVLTSNSQVKEKIADLGAQIRLIEDVEFYIKGNMFDLIPNNLGLQDQSINQTTAMYNTLLMERKRIIKGSSERNPTVVNLDAQMATLRKSIEQSLLGYKASLEFSLSEANNEFSRLQSRRTIAPGQEREFQDIKREQQIIESLYLYLLQKREENAIAMGATSPNALVIDGAYGGHGPISPSPTKFYIIAILLGFFVPLIIISLDSFFDNRIYSVEQVEKETEAPLLGDIPKSNSKDKIVVSENQNNSIAEAFRLVRTNIIFLLPKNSIEGHAIFVTSTIAGEGKTFVSFNLAETISATNRKVLLIGADMRKPKMNDYTRIPADSIGLSHFLADETLEIKDIVKSDTNLGFNFISSGLIPPNPSELIMNGRFEALILEAKKNFDIVIVDTPPINLVTDTLLLKEYSDLFIYVVRAGFLDKRLLKVPKSLILNGKLKNMVVLVNNTDRTRKEYGYGYGYGYGELESKKPWWKRKFS